MSQVFAGTDILENEWHGSANLDYAIHSWQEWISLNGEVNEAGSPYDIGAIDAVYRRGSADVADNTVTLPNITVERTDNAQQPLGGGVRLCLSLIDRDKNRCVAILIPSFIVTSTTNSWDDVI